MTPSRSQPKRRRRSATSLFLTIVLLAVSSLLWLNRQYASDVVHFWSYQPTSEMASIASRAGLSDSGIFNLYMTRPQIEDRTQFNGKCGEREQGTAILGCYVDNRIYVYNVTDQRLDGIKEVTAAHEMLHAVYQRMSDSEKQTVNGLVEAEYQKLSDNPSYADRMAFYARTEPGDRDNELHSIIGTEVASISPELEAHYQKYFSDRSKVVGLYANYNALFTSLDAQSKALSARLDALSKTIAAEMDQYDADVTRLNTDIAQFNNKASTSGGFTTRSEFDAERLQLQSRVDAVTAARTKVNQDIDTYNTLRDQYNSTLNESKNLYQSIDSTLAPAPKV